MSSIFEKGRVGVGALLADVAGIDGGGSRRDAAGTSPAPLTAGATPVAADPVSVAVTLTLGSRAAAVYGHSTHAALITTARGVQLHADATAYADTETDNAATKTGSSRPQRLPPPGHRADDRIQPRRRPAQPHRPHS